MQHVVVDCARAAERWGALSAHDQAAHEASQQQAAQAALQQQQDTRAAHQGRAAALQTVLSAPAIAADPALRDALAYVLGAS